MRQYDVIVAGKGITGASAAYHLKKQGFKVLVLFNDESQTDRSVGAFHVDNGDYITRVENAFGWDVAKKVWQFTAMGYDYLKDLLAKMGLQYDEASINYLASSHMEQRELQQVKVLLSRIFSQKGLQENSFQMNKWVSIPASSLKLELFGIFIEKLLEGVECQKAQIERIDETSSSINVVTLDGSKRSAEIVVGAAHIENQRLLDLPEGVIVPYLDQWHQIACDVPKEFAAAGSFVFWNYKYFQVFVEGASLVRVSGARFLRKNAGIGLSNPEVLPEIRESILRELELKGFSNPVVLSSQAMLGARPCDEIPLIGPVFGRQRQLVSTGYMGQGLVLGLLGGKCLSELIATGTSNHLPRILWPERLRSLGG